MYNLFAGRLAGAAIGTLLGVGATSYAGAQDSKEPTKPFAAKVEAPADPALDAALDELDDLEFGDLLNSAVTTASRKKQRLFDTPAAAFVITSDEIRRSGARSIPEALRLAPGMNIGQQDANVWGVASRGFATGAASSSDKLLVLVDGRTVYNPVSNGVDWQVQDYLLDDIERIEIIRGPAGALWGANAVNGVINIITKDAIDTEGVYVTGGAGYFDRAFTSVRYGTEITEDTFMRIYGKYRKRANYSDAWDGSDFYQGGLRLDRHFEGAQLSFHADGFSEERNRVFAIPTPTAPLGGPYFPNVRSTETYVGANAVAEYTREFSDDSNLRAQAFYSVTDQRQFSGVIEAHQLDFDLQHQFLFDEVHSVVWGLNYRWTPMRTIDNPFVTWTRAERSFQIFSVFLQDEIEVFEDRFWMTLGSKFEHNDYTQMEIQPNIRFRVKPAENQTIWGAVSRAVQTPSPSTQSAVFPILAGNPTIIGGFPFFGGTGTPLNLDLEASELISYELGYRVQASSTVSVDLAGFLNRYDGLFGGTIGAPVFNAGPPAFFVVPVFGNNNGSGDSYGFEFSTEWQAREDWRLSGHYSFIEDDFAGTFVGGGLQPESQASLRSSWDLPKNVELDLWGRWVGPTTAFGIPGYIDLDLRVGFSPVENMELSLVGQNLIEPARFEYGSGVAVGSPPSRIARTFYGQITYEF